MIIRHYQEVKAEPVTDAGAEKASVRWVIAEKDGAKNFFMRVFEIEPGGYTPLHHHHWEHEMFTDKKWPAKELIDKVSPNNPVILGRADSHSVLVFIPSNEEHQIKNTSQESFTFICLIPEH